MSTRTLKFPPNFTWGAATASYQIEGGTTEDGRTPSIWDAMCDIPGKVLNGDTGEVACDHYHRFLDDVRLMSSLGVPSYRFSVSWSRILPRGRGDVNPDGVAFYDNLINALVVNNIEPLVTLYHWDLPQCLQDEYGGWLSRSVITDFEAYASTCFELFGDRVKKWLTLNEPWCSAAVSYAVGEHAPGRSERAGTEPYVAAHHLLLAHGAAVKQYREKFASKQGGTIGITLNCDWREPLDSNSAADAEAADRALDWFLGWFAHPIWLGDYPPAMRRRCGDRLPKFTGEEMEMLKGSSDFFGLNHYSTKFVTDAAPKAAGEGKPGEANDASEASGGATLSMWGTEQRGGYFDDQDVTLSSHPRWTQTQMGWDVVPWGLHRLLLHIHHTYKPKGGIIITENGCAVDEPDLASATNDMFRVNYYQMYLSQVHRAMTEGADVRGYLAWSLLDNFEWSHGYGKRFGIVRVDYDTLERTPKASAGMLSEVWRTNELKIEEEIAEAALVGEPTLTSLTPATESD